MPVELGRRQVLYITLLLVVLASFLCFYRVDESLHPDSVLWYGGTQRFWKALANRDFAHSNQYPHPGLTLMWITGLILKLRGTLDGFIDQGAVLALKAPGAIVGVLATALTFPLALACWGKQHWRAALVLALLLLTDAGLLEQSRMAELDMPALGLAYLGIWVAILAYERDSWPAALGAGALFGGSALSKLTFAAIPATLMLILIGTSVLTRFRDRRGLKVAALATVGALVTLFVFWPALWVSPIVTLESVLRETSRLAEKGHARWFEGRRVRDPGVLFYVLSLEALTPPEIVLLASLGLVGLYFVRPLRKHYLWIILSFVPYLVMLVLAPKKLTRYVAPALPLLCILASAGIEWLMPRARVWFKRAPFVPVALVSLLLVGRYVRDVRLLPESEWCTQWPGSECDRPGDKHYMREMALEIGRDWEARGGQSRPVIYLRQTELMSPWLRAKRAKTPRNADYIVIWDYEFSDPVAGTLDEAAQRKLGQLGPELMTVRRSGRLIARVFRRAA